MRIDLDVPYSDKDKVKALGGKWDMSTRKWYVLDPSNLKPFVQWMSTDVKAFYRNNNV
jgi:hypothetical protein